MPAKKLPNPNFMSVCDLIREVRELRTKLANIRRETWKTISFRYRPGDESDLCQAVYKYIIGKTKTIKY